MSDNKRPVLVSARIPQDLKIALVKKSEELGVTVSELVGTYIAGGHSGDYSGKEGGSDLALEVVTMMQDYFPVLSSAEVSSHSENNDSSQFEISLLKEQIEVLEAEKGELSLLNEDSILIKLPKEHEKDLEKSIKSVQKIMKKENPNLSREEAIEYLLLHGCAMCEHDTGFFGTEYKIKEVVEKKQKGK